MDVCIFRDSHHHCMPQTSGASPKFMFIALGGVLGLTGQAHVPYKARVNDSDVPVPCLAHRLVSRARLLSLAHDLLGWIVIVQAPAIADGMAI